MCFFNHKLGPVQKDGYQYCSKCGKAFAVECNHKFKIIKEVKFCDDIVFVSTCINCGKMKKYSSAGI